MKKGNTILLLFLFFLIHYNSYSQTEIILFHESSDKYSRYYNMENAELYIIDGVDTYFVTKTEQFKFLISNEILEKIDQKEFIYLFIKTDEYYFLSKFYVSEFKLNDWIRISIHNFYDSNDNIVFIYHSFLFNAVGFVTVVKREPRKEFYENND